MATNEIKPIESAKKKVVKPVQKKKIEPVVYIGPNMGGELPITQFSVHKNGVSAMVKARMEKDANFAKLFVSPADLTIARQQLKSPASVIFKAFNAVVKTRRK